MGDWSVKQKLREDILEAVELGDRTRVEKLLNEGADVDESVGAYLSGNTLLTLAAEKGHVNIAELLIDRGANLNVKINNNTDIEQFAREKDLVSLADYICRKKELNKRLQDSVRTGDEDGVRSSLTEGADVNLEVTIDQQPTSVNLLLLALTEGHLEAAKLLIEHNIQLDYVAKWEDGKTDTALSYAERMDQRDIVQLIKKKQEGETIGGGDYESMNGLNPQGNGKNATTMMTSQNTSNSEVTMDDVDADKEFENQENIAPPRNSNKTRRQRSNKSTSCTIT